eukprot:187227-Prorocentrum_minimum.AAC.1
MARSRSMSTRPPPSSSQKEPSRLNSFLRNTGPNRLGTASAASAATATTTAHTACRACSTSCKTYQLLFCTSRLLAREFVSPPPGRRIRRP